MEKKNIIENINHLRKKKNAIILAHYYQDSSVQDIADFVGDSLELSKRAKDNDAEIIVFAGVRFMAETAKMLSPNKKVFLPDLDAGCSLADSCKYDDFKEFISKYDNPYIISYINTSADIKTLSDIICTSSNAVEIVNNAPKERTIIFAPDKNLGNYIKSITGIDMVIWDGSCHVHRQFSIKRILELTRNNQDAKFIAHPECESPILNIAHFIGSTSALLDYVGKNNCNKYIVATESGILHQMKKNNPKKIFIAAPPLDSTCGCSDCEFMKLNTLEKIYDCLNEEKNEILLDENIIKKAIIPIEKMLNI